MSKLCKFTYDRSSFLIDPNTVELVKADTSDGTCLLSTSSGEKLWVDGDIDEVLGILNSGRE